MGLAIRKKEVVVNKRVVRLLVVLGVLGVAGAAAQRSGFLSNGAPKGASAGRLPLTCRLQRHGWRIPQRSMNTPIRLTCSRCEHIDVPMP